MKYKNAAVTLVPPQPSPEAAIKLQLVSAGYVRCFFPSAGGMAERGYGAVTGPPRARLSQCHLLLLISLSNREEFEALGLLPGCCSLWSCSGDVQAGETLDPALGLPHMRCPLQSVWDTCVASWRWPMPSALCHQSPGDVPQHQGQCLGNILGMFPASVFTFCCFCTSEQAGPVQGRARGCTRSSGCLGWRRGALAEVPE